MTAISPYPVIFLVIAARSKYESKAIHDHVNKGTNGLESHRDNEKTQKTCRKLNVKFRVVAKQIHTSNQPSENMEKNLGISHTYILLFFLCNFFTQKSFFTYAAAVNFYL